MINWLNSLTHGQNMSLSVTFMLLAIIATYWVCAWAWRDDGYKVTNLPKDPEMEAMKAYTRNKEKK